MTNELIALGLQDAEERMKGARAALEGDLQGYRTGRASPHLLDKIKVEVYGVEMDLKQLANVSIPNAQQLAVRPFDKSSLSAIERAILKSDLGLNPNNDGNIIYLTIPRLTEERRRDLAKLIHSRTEDARVAVRNVRRDILKDIRDFEKDGEFSEDESKEGQETLQELTDFYIKEIDKLGKDKESEIMEV